MFCWQFADPGCRDLVEPRVTHKQSDVTKHRTALRVDVHGGSSPLRQFSPPVRVNTEKTAKDAKDG